MIILFGSNSKVGHITKHIEQSMCTFLRMELSINFWHFSFDMLINLFVSIMDIIQIKPGPHIEKFEKVFCQKIA